MSKNPRAKQHKSVTTQCYHRSNPGVLSVNPAKGLHYFWILQTQHDAWTNSIPETTQMLSKVQPSSLLTNIQADRRTFQCRTEETKPKLLPRTTAPSKWSLRNEWMQSSARHVNSLPYLSSVQFLSTSRTFGGWRRLYFNYTPLLNNGNSTYNIMNKKN